MVGSLDGRVTGESKMGKLSFSKKKKGGGVINASYTLYLKCLLKIFLVKNLKLCFQNKNLIHETTMCVCKYVIWSL